MAEREIVGCLIGTAVGDALGLPYEGLSRRRGAKLLGEPDRYRFFFQRGMVSDDTEHTCMVAQSLIGHTDTEEYCRSLGWRFRWWLLGMPAGIGLATLKSILRLWIGFSPRHSGVFSAGNGPAMRAAILGATIDEEERLQKFVHATSRITHTDPKAEYGALAVALAARMAREDSCISGKIFVERLRFRLNGNGAELLSLIERAVASAEAGEATTEFANSLGLKKGVSGYVYHSVPVALHAWLRNPHDFRNAVISVIQCGGDTDSTAAIVGGIVGTAVGLDGIPKEWIDGLMEWPRSVTWMKKLGHDLAESKKGDVKVKAPRLPIWGVLPRNLFFMSVVLFHAFRRALPPY